MEIKLKLLFFLLIIKVCIGKCVPVLENVELKCSTPSEVKWFDKKSFFTCSSVQELTVKTHFANVNNVVFENHLIFDENIIEGLVLKGSKINYIPNGINTFFPKLIALDISNSSLISLEKENLEQFGESLQYLNVQNNELTFLKSDVFQFNINLVQIDLSFNKIKFYGPGLIESLIWLREISLNGCIDSKIDSFDFTLNSKDSLKDFDTTHGCNDIEAISENEKQDHVTEEIPISSTKEVHTDVQIKKTTTSSPIIRINFNENRAIDKKICERGSKEFREHLIVLFIIAVMPVVMLMLTIIFILQNNFITPIIVK